MNEVAGRLSQAQSLALDTEADSLHHYIEKLCLLQISDGSQDYVLDPLAGLDLKPIVELLSGKELICHGADFDLRILKRTYGFKPRLVFDTMIAAQLLGYEKQSLADLVFRHCQVSLSKANQKADWSRRPLEDELLTYAANDTHFLHELRDKMTEELKTLGRVEWHRQNCRRLVDTIAGANDRGSSPQTDWQIKGARALKGRALTILKVLWEWREEQASRLDRPTFKILHSKTLLEISRWAAEHPGEDIAKLPGAPRNVKGELRDVLNRLIDHSKKLPQVRLERTDSGKARKRLDESMMAKVDAMKKVRDEIAGELKIQPSLLSTNAELETLVAEAPKTLEGLRALDCLLPWQVDLVARSYLEVIKS